MTKLIEERIAEIKEHNENDIDQICPNCGNEDTDKIQVWYHGYITLRSLIKDEDSVTPNEKITCGECEHEWEFDISRIWD